MRPRALLIGACLALAGCEKLPWSPPPKQAASSTTAPLASPSSAISIPTPVVPATEAIATVNGSAISTRDVENIVQELRASREMLGQSWTPLSEEEQADRYDLHDIVGDLITLELRRQDALARGLDRDLRVQQHFAYVARTVFAREWLGWQLNRLSVTQEEIDQFYQQNQWGFREPERIKVRQLVFSSEDLAKAALVKLLEGVDFVQLGRQNSLRPEALDAPLADTWVMRSGDKAIFAPTDDTVRDLKDATLEQAAFAIDATSGISSYVKGADGNFHIFQLVERQPGRQRPLVEVSDQIRDVLRLQKLNTMTDELRAKAKIERFPERLRGIAQ